MRKESNNDYYSIIFDGFSNFIARINFNHINHCIAGKKGSCMCVLDLGSSVRIDCHYFLHISSGQITDSHTVNCNSVLKFRV